MSDVETLLGQIAQIGAAGDDGYRRLAWTEEDARLGQWFAAACAERGLSVSTDRCGNQWAWWGDPDADVPPAEAVPAAGQDADPTHADHEDADHQDRDHHGDDHHGDEHHGEGHAEHHDGGHAEHHDGGHDGEDDHDAVPEGEPAQPASAPPPVAGYVVPRGGVVTGSHLDSVPGGGPYDGPLGIVSALLAVDELRQQGFTPRRPLGIVRFVDEEGARFGVPCTGSRLLTGQLEPADVLERTDADGVTYGEAAAKAGLDVEAIGRDDAVLRRVAAFVELHVEQGFTLAAEEVDFPLGVCGLIRTHGRWVVDLPGRADHAGTARFADRADPMLELARLVTTVRSVAGRQ
ncbi:MAG TPA: M20/M25/M40 family metallo-hydrolase, partial [Kineosporiaceae bacterium]|nr:M20/M25/M40 family metallo-hydrolase [Kineosporiaceae bacterium]